jgi:hypothetical protein
MAAEFHARLNDGGNHSCEGVRLSRLRKGCFVNLDGTECVLRGGQLQLVECMHGPAGDRNLGTDDIDRLGSVSAR